MIHWANSIKAEKIRSAKALRWSMAGTLRIDKEAGGWGRLRKERTAGGVCLIPTHLPGCKTVLHSNICCREFCC